MSDTMKMKAVAKGVEKMYVEVDGIPCPAEGCKYVTPRLKFSKIEVETSHKAGKPYTFTFTECSQHGDITGEIPVPTKSVASDTLIV